MKHQEYRIETEMQQQLKDSLELLQMILGPDLLGVGFVANTLKI